MVYQQKTREADFAASLKVQSSGGKKSLKETEANVSDAGDNNARVGWAVGGNLGRPYLPQLKVNQKT